jgi:hypothetical protein
LILVLVVIEAVLLVSVDEASGIKGSVLFLLPRPGSMIKVAGNEEEGIYADAEPVALADDETDGDEEADDQV